MNKLKRRLFPSFKKAFLLIKKVSASRDKFTVSSLHIFKKRNLKHKYSTKVRSNKNLKFLIDTFALNVFVFIFLFTVIKTFPLNLKVLNPIKNAFQDFDYTDYYFSELTNLKYVSNDIVIVNIEDLNREGIAHTIDMVSKGSPKVIGLDIFFRKQSKTENDSLLKRILGKTKNLVGIHKCNKQGHTNITSFPG